MENLDAIDRRILQLLQQDGRLSNIDLAQQVGLKPPTVLRRVKLLEERGFIRGYTALVDPLALGLTVTAFIFVDTENDCDFTALGAELARLPGVQEVHHVIGEWTYLLKVRTASPQTLNDLVYHKLRKRPIRRTLTTLATTTLHETTALPLHDELNPPQGKELSHDDV